MILFVDYEHASVRDRPHGERVLAARTWITYRLQEITAQTCLLQPYGAVTPELVDRHDITAVFISGQSADVSAYDQSELAGVRDVIRSRRVPMFGFCGGHQLIAETLGVPVERIGPSTHPDASDDPADPKHWIHELGYRPVDIVADHPLLDGVGPDPVMRQAHSFEVTALPDGFTRLATTEVSPNQLIVHDDAKIVGTQFHPEYYTDEHPAGHALIENFTRWAAIT